MDNQILNMVCSQVYQKFPEIRGVHPTIKPQGYAHHLLIFKGSTQTADGKTMHRIVRVVIDQAGNIGKLTTSR